MPYGEQGFIFDPVNILGHIEPVGKKIRPKIKRVIFNDPATIVIWSDGTKTVVKCQPGDVYDQEKGLLLCIAKKHFGNKGNFNNELKKFLPEKLRSVQEMREFLYDFCKVNVCKECRLGVKGFRCGRGTHFFKKSGDGKYSMTDDEIREAYTYILNQKGGLI